MPSLTLTTLASTFTVHRLSPGAELPAELSSCEHVFVSRTPAELSIVCPADVAVDSERSSSPWRCLVVEGPLALSQLGVLANLTSALARAEVSTFALSTFDTDYLLVPADRLAAAQAALRAEGHTTDPGQLDALARGR